MLSSPMMKKREDVSISAIWGRTSYGGPYEMTMGAGQSISPVHHVYMKQSIVLTLWPSIRAAHCRPSVAMTNFVGFY